MSPEPFPENWTPPAGLGYGSLRPVRLTRQGKLMIALCLMMLLGSAFLGNFLFHKARQQNDDRALLLDQGVPVTATVTRLWRTSDKDSRHMVTYRFLFGGEAYSHGVSISSSRWRALHIGDELPVTVLPSHPALNHPAAWPPEALPLWFPYPVTLLMAAMALVMILPIRRQYALLLEGRPAPGRVTGHRRASHNQSVLLYEFRQLSGAIAKGRSTSRRPPADGTPLCILYDPERPRRSAIYPMSLVRLG